MRLFIKESRFSVKKANKSFFDHYYDELKREEQPHEEIKRRAAENFIAELTRYIAKKYNDEIAHYEAKKRDDGEFNVESSTDNYELWGTLKVRDNYTVNYKKSVIFLDSENFKKIKTL